MAAGTITVVVKSAGLQYAVTQVRVEASYVLDASLWLAADQLALIKSHTFGMCTFGALTASARLASLGWRTSCTGIVQRRCWS